MSELATFFRHRREDPGATYHNRWKTEKGVQEISVYCRKAVGSTFFKPEESPRDLSAYQEAVKSRGGGIIVMSIGDGVSKTIELRRVGANNYQLPQRFLMLPPGRPPFFCELDGSHKVSAASHLIVPADAEAEQRLQHFYDQLPWFSPDFEALVLNAIRKPSVDSRLDDLETRVYGQTIGDSQRDAARGRWERVWLAVRNVLTNGATYASLAIGVIIVLLYMDVLRLEELKDEIYAQRAADTGNKNKAAASGGSKTETSASRDTHTLTAATQQFLTELEQKKESRRKLRNLYDQYFQTFRPDAKDIDKWYAPDGEGNQQFLSGLIEVQNLRNGNNDPDDVSKRFMEAVQCRLNKCTDDNEDDITAGLKNLTEYLKTLK